MSYPMYDAPALGPANEAFLDAFRGLLAREGIDPEHAPLDQMCGYPLQTVHRGRFTVLGTPAFRLAGCEGTTHRAFIVVAASSTARHPRDLRGCAFAVNAMDSNTGMNLPRHLFAPLAARHRFLGRLILTGSHRASMDAVAHGRADAAAIDCVTFGLHAAHEPAAVGELRIIGRTRASPAIPFITPRATSKRTTIAMRRALARLSADAQFAPLRRALRLERIDTVAVPAYDIVLTYRDEAVALGYPQLA